MPAAIATETRVQVPVVFLSAKFELSIDLV